MARAPDVVLRQLEADDYDKGFLPLLGQLTSVGDVSKSEFLARFKELDESEHYHIWVAEDRAKSRIIGAATLLVEPKFIHGCAKAGHIEDVVVDEAARGLRLGQRLVEKLLEVGEKAGCYKVILDCAEKNVGFYEKCGFAVKGVQMAKYFE